MPEITKKKKPTIHDVAELAGVSIKTVSRVVNREENTREKTREKVLAAIRKLKYAPNLAARGLAGSHSFMIGLLYDNPNANYIINIQNGVLECCRQEGFNLLIHPCDFKSPDLAQQIVDMVRNTRLAGLILTPPLCDNKKVTNRLKKENITYVRVSPGNPDTSSPYVLCDDMTAAYNMTLHLLEQGHTRIALLKGHPDHASAEFRLQGFKQALAEKNVSLPKGYIQQGYFNFSSGRSCTAKLLSFKNPPTAIFASNDDMAAGAIYEARSQGIEIPAQLSVAGFDDAPVGQQILPSLTTVQQPILEMAKQAALILIKTLRNKGDLSKPKENYVSLACKLLIRESTNKST